MFRADNLPVLQTMVIWREVHRFIYTGLVLPRIRPMRLRLAKEPFDGIDHMFELKQDGFRTLAYIENGNGKLMSLQLRNLRFESLRNSLATLPVQNAILDGEIVILDSESRRQFNWLVDGQQAGEAIYYVFDLVWIDGEDLRNQALLQNRTRRLCIFRKAGSSPADASGSRFRPGCATIRMMCRANNPGRSPALPG